MNACPNFPATPTAPGLDPRSGPVDRWLLAVLRCAARSCRAAARLEPERACSLIDASPDAAARTLLCTLPAALGQPIRVYGPRETDLSFDERWILSAIAAVQRGDADSLHFLIARRVPAHRRRWLIVLLRRVAEAAGETTVTFDPVPTEKGDQTWHKLHPNSARAPARPSPKP